MQVWPLFKNLPQAILAAASSTFTSGPTIAGDLPPNSSVTEVKCLAAAAITTFPMAGLPVKKI